MCIQAIDFYFSDLCTEKWSQNRLKRGFLALKCSWYYCVWAIANCKKIHFSAFADSKDGFRHKDFENRMENDCFMVRGSIKTCKRGHLLR